MVLPKGANTPNATRFGMPRMAMPYVKEPLGGDHSPPAIRETTIINAKHSKKRWPALIAAVPYSGMPENCAMIARKKEARKNNA